MSDMYAIKTSTLTALGDAVRNKVIGTSELPYASDTITTTDSYLVDSIYPYEFSSAVKKIKLTINLESEFPYNNVYLPLIYYTPRYTTGTSGNWWVEVPPKDTSIFPYEIMLDSNAFTIRFDTAYSAQYNVSYSFTAIGLDENGNEYKYTPLEMADKVNELMVIPDSALNITGACSYKFSNNGWNWFIEDYGDKVITKDITNADYMFSNSRQLTEIPFDINLSKSTTNIERMFEDCNQLEEIPNVSWVEMPTSTVKIQYLFNSCSLIKTIPEWFIELAEYNFNTAKSKGSWTDFGPFNGLFSDCVNIREIPERLMAVLYNPVATGYYYTLIYSNPFGSMYRVNELVNIPYEDVELTSNQFSNSFSHLQHLKRLTIATNEDGSPFIRKWRSQTFDFIMNMGYGSLGKLDDDKEVKDDATYQALKDDADYWTRDINYSRYNHDSAVETINSLPDTSAYVSAKGGTNTIKFTGAAGALTDGGAINTLTEEEIAVAAAKGWTVTLV